MTTERAIEELKKLNDSRCVGCRQICRDHPNEMCSAYQAIMHAIAVLENTVENGARGEGTGNTYSQCKSCGHFIRDKEYDYCPMCGAPQSETVE
jgi:hypothetical protein